MVTAPVRARRQKQVLHYPRLDTVLMVEGFIRDHSGEYKRKSLWANLPRRMMYQTYRVVLDYLQISGKVAIDSEGKVAWIWNPALVREYLARPELSAR